MDPRDAVANPLAETAPSPPGRRRSSVTMRDLVEMMALPPPTAADASSVSCESGVHARAGSDLPLLAAGGAHWDAASTTSTSTAAGGRRAAPPGLRAVTITEAGDDFTQVLSPLVTAASSGGAAAFAFGGSSAAALGQPLTKRRDAQPTGDLRAALVRAHQARLREDDRSQLSALLHFLAFAGVLIAAYACYRAAFCDLLLHWQCDQKVFQRHWSDILSLVTIGGTIAATGPTLRGVGWRMRAACLLVFASSMTIFGALGELPFLHNSLNSGSSWAPPAVFVYGPAIGVVALSAAYALGLSLRRSWAAAATSALVLASIGAVMGSALATGAALRVPFSRLRFQPHHYQLAWVMALLLRDPTDRLSLLLRWLFVGIMANGLAAWGVDPIFGGRYEQSGCISIA